MHDGRHITSSPPPSDAGGASGRSAPQDDLVGERIYALAAELFPICRSISGDGVRASLKRLARDIPLQLHEIPTGTQVFDWVIPPEWNIREAFVKDSSGRRVIDFKENTLHVVSYSVPVHRTMSLSELRPHLFSLPDQPTLIPYRTSYYKESWGFCLPHDVLESLPDDTYEVLIDSSLCDGSLTYGECVLPGRTKQEFLLSAHVCHPSLANDNCSGLAVLTALAQHLRSTETRYTYRFLFAPGSIGALAWLSRNESAVERIRHGLVVSCVGDAGGPVYKRSRRGDAEIDRAMAHLLAHSGPGAKVIDFSPYGYDERQFCSPAFDLPIGLFQRSQFGCFPEYHTSADNLDFISAEELERSYRLLVRAIETIEGNRTLQNLSPKGEPQLGRRGLYPQIGGSKQAEETMALLWVLNLSDGKHSLLDIAERSGLHVDAVVAAATRLEGAALLQDLQLSS